MVGEGGVSLSARPGPGTRLDRSLMRVVESGDPLAAAADSGYRVREDRIEVMIIARSWDVEDLVTWLWQHDARLVVVFRHLVRADVVPRILVDLASHPEVVWVRRPLEPEVPGLGPADGRAGFSTSELITEGLAAMNGVAWHAAGYSGEGLKVAVIDTGFGGYQGLLGSELPNSGAVHFHAFGSSRLNPTNVHGTACAEIIHDIVPDAELYLAMMEDLVTFYQAMDWLRDQGVAVVLNSAAWLAVGPGDGTSMMHELIDHQVLDDGMFWAMGAGNYREQHWQGRTVDRDSDRWVEFDDRSTETLMLVDSSNRLRTFNSGDSISVYISWDDWVAVNQDFDVRLFLVSGSQSTQVAASNDSQNGGPGQTPAEYLRFQVRTRGTYGVRVYRTNADVVHDLELFTPRRDLDHPISGGSIAQPCDSPHVVAVAASSHAAPYSYYEFSSQGPTNGPGGTLDGGFRKPDITGYAYVTTASRGYQVFSGTSAAGPHAAGAAALVWSARPGWSNLEVRRYLEHTAPDMGAPGCDNDYGCGRLHLGAPVAAQAQCVAEVAPPGESFAAEGGAGTVVVTVDSGCPWFADSPAEWIHVIEGGAGDGNGTVSFAVDSSPSCASRQAVLFVSGRLVTIDQDGRDPRKCSRRPSGRKKVSGTANAPTG